MQSLFSIGFQNLGRSAWLGVDPAATDVKEKTETSWLDVFNTGITSAADAYGSYGDIKEGEAAAEGKEAEAAVRAANERALQTMQQTNALIESRNKIMGLDKTVFAVLATFIGLGVVGTFVYMAAKK